MQAVQFCFVNFEAHDGVDVVVHDQDAGIRVGLGVARFRLDPDPDVLHGQGEPDPGRALRRRSRNLARFSAAV